MIILWRLLLLFLCAEALLFLRWNFGLLFAGLLGVMLTLKHGLMQHLLLSQSYGSLLQLGAVSLVLNIVARFLLAQGPMAQLFPRAIFTPPWHSGNRLWRLIGIREKWTLLYVEPAVIVFQVILAAQTACCGRFRPYWHDMLGRRPRPPLPPLAFGAWYEGEAAWALALLLPLVTLVALVLHNRDEYTMTREGRDEAVARRLREAESATAATVSVPELTFPAIRPARLPVIPPPSLHRIREHHHMEPQRTEEDNTMPKASQWKPYREKVIEMHRQGRSLAEIKRYVEEIEGRPVADSTWYDFVHKQCGIPVPTSGAALRVIGPSVDRAVPEAGAVAAHACQETADRLKDAITPQLVQAVQRIQQASDVRQATLMTALNGLAAKTDIRQVIEILQGHSQAVQTLMQGQNQAVQDTLRQALVEAPSRRRRIWGRALLITGAGWGGVLAALAWWGMGTSWLTAWASRWPF